MDELINLAETKNFITQRLKSLTSDYQKYFKINITDYTKYPLSYFYYSCHNEEIFFQLLPQFLANHPDIALSFIHNSIYSDITFSVPIKVKLFDKHQVKKIFHIAMAEVIQHKELVEIYCQQFSVEYRNINMITDKSIYDFIVNIISKYKNDLIISFLHSRSKMLSLFAMSYPFLTADDINLMLPIIASNTNGLSSFFKILDNLDITILNKLNNDFLLKLKAKCFMNKMVMKGN